MTLEPTAPSSSPRSASARSPRRRWSHAGQCTKVDPTAEPAVVGLLGCGVMAGLGAAIEHRQRLARRLGRGDRLRRRRRRRDRRRSAGRRRARSSPSTATTGSSSGQRSSAPPTPINACADATPVEAVQELTDGIGADVVIDAVGRPETWKQAFYARDLAGTVVLVGVPTPDMTIGDAAHRLLRAAAARSKSSWYGDCLPERDFPTLVDLYQQGRLPLEKFVSERQAGPGRGRVRDHPSRRGAALGGGCAW